MSAAHMQAYPLDDVGHPLAAIALGGGPCDLRSSFRIFAAVRHARSARAAAPVGIMGRADFVHHVAMHLPDVAAQIAEDDFGILHLEMGVMKRVTQGAIEHYELHTVRRHFAFLAYLYEHADSELYGAILVSYLEPLFIDARTPEYDHARGLLPSNLADALKRAETRHALLSGMWQVSGRGLAPDAISLTLD